MPTITINHLRDALKLGLGTVTRIWNYKAKDWVSSVFAADIDNDGEVEVVACSRDGRVHRLTRWGDYRWDHVVGTKAWVGTAAASSSPIPEQDDQARIIVGTRDGKVYVLNKDGKTVRKDGKEFAFDHDGREIEGEEAKNAYWYDTRYVIRQISIDPQKPYILIGSEDRCAYALNYETGELRWSFQTEGWVRAVLSYDIDGDGQAEVLVGSVDRHLYVLDQQGQFLAKHYMKYPVQTIFVADVDQDGHSEILVSTDGKDLVALTYHEDKMAAKRCFEEKWRTRFENRLLCLCVTDIDADGRNEIVAGSEDKHIYFLDEHGKIIWRHNHKYRVFSLYPYDLDKDGIPELLVGSENERVGAMRIRLRKDLDKKIRKYYRSLSEYGSEILHSLTADERTLLIDILNKTGKAHVTLKEAEDLLAARHYERALSLLLQLEQDKVQRLWDKNTIGRIRTVCFRRIANDPRREIIVGTSEGDVRAFNPGGRHLWTNHLDDHIVDVQTGFIDNSRQEEIVACSSEHHVYILGGTHRREQRDVQIDAWMSSICVMAPSRQSPAEIIIGSEENKLYIYGSDLQAPREMISLPEGVRTVRAHTPSEENAPEIIAGGLGKRVYACTHQGRCLWTYDTHDHIRAICIKDINGDGKLEVLIGSEDRNIHVLDSSGHLLWRYYLPHSALAVDAADADQDGKVEIFVGCADGYMYVFNKEGDFLWKYQARDRIHAVRVEDIDDDGNVEIAIGSEDELELLQVISQRQVSALIAQCWSALCHKQPAEQIIDNLLHASSADPFLRSFALLKLTEQAHFSPKDFDTFEMLAKEGPLEVRKTLVRVVVAHYTLCPPKARLLLQQLSIDAEQEVRDMFVEHMPELMKHDWELGFHYLKHFSEKSDRFARRAVVRQLHQLIDTHLKDTDWNRDIFDLLLKAALDKESQWIQQEAARTLAHFLNRYNGRLIVYVHLFIVKGVRLPILEHMAYATTTPAVKQHLNAVIPMLSGLNEDNALERTQQVVKALDAASGLLYGRDTRLIYNELCLLLSLDTIEDIAQYACQLHANQFSSENQFAHLIFSIFDRLSSVMRKLKIYLRREGVHDRLTSLLEAVEAIDKMQKYVEQQYSFPLLGSPLTKLPDHHLFVLLLKKWRELVLAQLNELRGRAELKAELQTRYARHEEQVAIWLNVTNIGRSSANNVKITLLHSEEFEVVGRDSFETETILPQEETTAEFVIKPYTLTLNLLFEIIYDDAEETMKTEEFGDRLELRESPQEFRYIPNPYSTGTPTHDSKMFYGREADMAFLQDNLARAAKTVIVLYGQRRSGKTTVLLQLINSPALDKHIPVLIDLQRASYHMNINKFLYRMAYYITQALKKKHILVCQPEQQDFEADPTHIFDVFLDAVEAQLQQQKLILLIDEFEVLEEQVVKGRIQAEIFEYLRDILQHRQSINFLFSGTHKITEYTKWYRSIFFNIARHYRLSRLSPQGAEDLIQKPVEGFLEYEPLTVKKIRQLTADQPYLIHLMCRALVDYCNDKRKAYVTIHDVNIVLREVMQTGQFHFDWLWDQIAPEERVVLSSIAEGGREEGRWLSLVEIEEVHRRYHIPFKREYLLASLKALVDADIIEGSASDSRNSALDSSRFRIPVGLTREWLLKERPLEVVRKEMSS